jgi:F420-dependent hydroxymycolic acid dehydrogenase
LTKQVTASSFASLNAPLGFICEFVIAILGGTVNDLSSQAAWESSLGMNRRTLLKCAGTLMGASTLSANLTFSQESSGGKRVNNSSFNTKMMGFMLPHEQFPVSKLVDYGVAAERAGFDLLATSDHLQPWQANEGHSGQAWVTMAAVGQRTKHVWIGPTVTCPTFRYNPAVVAEAFASLNLLTPGRIFLGIGSGEAINEEASTGSWPKWDERSERFIESADLIRKLWAGQQVSHKGKYYSVNAKLYDRPATPIPLLMAANGPKAMRRAGQYADGLITDGKTWKQYKSEFEAGARVAGKEAGRMPVLIEQYAIVGSKQDAEKAAELWRFGPKAFKKYYNVRDPEEIEREANSEIPLEQVYGDWPVGTDPKIHLKTVNELFESGATIVNIHSGQPDLQPVIEFYGREVLPKVRMKAAA